jgi:hypothetical protein
MSEYVTFPLSQREELPWDAKRVMAFQAAVAITIATISKDASPRSSNMPTTLETLATFSSIYRESMKMLE